MYINFDIYRMKVKNVPFVISVEKIAQALIYRKSYNSEYSSVANVSECNNLYFLICKAKLAFWVWPFLYSQQTRSIIIYSLY